MTIYSIKDYQVWQNREILNVFWYEGATGGEAENLALAFIADVLPAVRALQSTTLFHDRVVVEAFDSITDFHEQSVGAFGTSAAAGDQVAAFVALGFRLNRTTKLTRHGQKRFAGVTEDLVSGENIVASAQGAVDALEAALADTISLVGGDYVPVIMERAMDVNGVYQLTGNTNRVSSATFTGVTTQNTRKA